MTFSTRIPLGRTGLSVSRVGLGTGLGRLPTREVERAFDEGINYLYWGSLRGKSLRDAIRQIGKSRRDQLVLVVQSYSRNACLMRGSLERALRSLRTDHTDLFLLGWWNQPPPRKLVDEALSLRERGLAKNLMISCHDRTTFERYAKDPAYGAIMVRYNAAHPGAEKDVFPLLPDANRPGVVAYTATRWGGLVDPAQAPPGERVPTATDCYRFALSSPHVDVVLSAPQTAAQLDQTLATLRAGPMDADELSWMKRVGSHVKARASQRPTTSIIDRVDRLVAWWSGSSRDAIR